jgi:hypothetical protein
MSIRNCKLAVATNAVAQSTLLQTDSQFDMLLNRAATDRYNAVDDQDPIVHRAARQPDGADIAGKTVLDLRNRGRNDPCGRLYRVASQRNAPVHGVVENFAGGFGWPGQHSVIDSLVARTVREMVSAATILPSTAARIFRFE